MQAQASHDLNRYSRGPSVALPATRLTGPHHGLRAVDYLQLAEDARVVIAHREEQSHSIQYQQDVQEQQRPHARRPVLDPRRITAVVTFRLLCRTPAALIQRCRDRPVGCAGPREV